MVAKLKLSKIGNSVGAILPKEALAQMHVDLGDALYLTEAPGGFFLTPFDPDFETQMNEARRVMRRRRNALRQLAS